MSMHINSELTNFPTSNKQIELIESIEYVHGPQLTTEDLLKLRSVNAFVKKYFESRNLHYSQVLSVSNDFITCKAFVGHDQVSECTESTFNKARVKAAILAIQEFDIDILKLWLSNHKEDLQNYLAV